MAQPYDIEFKTDQYALAQPTFFFTMAVVMGLTCWLGSMGPAAPGPLTFWATILLASYLVHLVVRRLEMWSVRKDLKAARREGRSFPDAIRHVFQLGNNGKAAIAGAILEYARAIEAAAWPEAGVIRIGTPLPKIIPLDKQFEPLLLNRRDPGFQAATGHKARRPRVYDVVLGLLFLYAFGPDFLRGRVNLPDLILLAMYFLPPLAVYVYRQVYAVQWLAIPGGVVERNPLGKGLTLHSSATCRILMIRHRHRFKVAVLPEQGPARSVSLDEVEAEYLLAAWLSPLPTPEVETLHDLTVE